MARLLLGVTGGIAAYKAVEIVRLATAAGHAVRVVQTPASLHFVGRATFEGVTGAPVLVDDWESDPARGAYPGDPAPRHDPISHLELVARADAFAIAPASANTIAKLAGGHADNLLTSVALASTAPLVVAPAMNSHMWAHPATRANVETLRLRGATIVAPGAGRLASRGEWGPGRLAEPAEVLASVEAVVAGGPGEAVVAGGPGEAVVAGGPGEAVVAGGHGEAVVAGGPGEATAEVPSFAPRSMDGLRVLVTAGGTREPIDSVRYVGNRSSGRMGLALAAEAARRGAEVTLVAANVALGVPDGVRAVAVETAAQLQAAVVEECPHADVLLMAAAVADFRPAQAQDVKIKKSGHDELALALEPTTDVLRALANARHPGQILVGFAAEHGEGGLVHARAKLESKGLDAVVLNDISRTDIGFDSEDNEVTILTAAGEQAVPLGPKAAVAAAVLDSVDALRADTAGRG